MPAPLSAEVVKFDEFELDCNRYQLLRAGRRMKLERLPMELLVLLLEKEGHLLTRDGMTDELITMLARNSDLRVISRTSTMQYRKVHRPCQTSRANSASTAS